ncbi:MAG: hypothetical protein ACLP5H_26185 [Desulfomonilaceae bacterium]
MSNGSTKPKPRPRSVEEWREKRKKRYGNDGGKGGFRILPRRVLDSDAFNELSKSAKLVLILSLDQLDYWLNKKHKGQPKRDSTVGLLRNDGRFSLPNNLLKERGINGSDTIAKARRELVAAGFWETVETGTLQQSGVFRWSDNWVTYNQRSIYDRMNMDAGAKAPGYCHYPNITKYNEGRRADIANLKDLEPKPAQEDDPLNQEPRFPVQLELFSELAA